MFYVIILYSSLFSLSLSQEDPIPNKTYDHASNKQSKPIRILYQFEIGNCDLRL